MRRLFSTGLTIGMFLIALTGGFQLAFEREALAAEPTCPGGASPNPNVIWCDDFEDGTALDTWAWARGNPVQCAASYGFSSSCAAWTGTLSFDGAWGYNGNFGDRVGWGTLTEFYNRIYIYFSPDYKWGNVGDKGVYFERQDKAFDNIKVGYNAWGAGMPDIHSYAFGVLDQNQGKDISFQPGKWYLVEWYLKLNTPGMADGVVKMWVDDASVPITTQTLRLHYNNLLIRAAGQTGGYDLFFLSDYSQRCDPGCLPSVPYWMKWDQIVVSKGPIGPMGGPTDKTPPSSPTGLTVK